MFLAFVLGISLTFSYAPFSLWWLMLLSLSGFIYLLSLADKKQGFKLGFAFGLGWFGAGISWVHVSIADFGGLPLIASIGLMVLLCSYLALYPAFASLILTRYFTSRLWPAVLPLIWLTFETLRGWLFTGFPWLSLGYSQLSSPLAGWFAVIGEVGVSTLLVLLCTSLAILIPQKKWLQGLILASTVLISGSVLNNYQWAKPTGEVVNVSMVQGNIEQALRWTPEQDQPTMEKYQRLTSDHWQSDIIIWPEAAIPKLEPIAQDYLSNIDNLAAKHGAGLITGIVNYNFETREAYNNLIGLGLKHEPSQQNDSIGKGQYHYLHNNRFAKHHLLPIGEFIPFEDWIRGIAPIFDLPMSSFSRGSYQQDNLLAKGYHLAPAICFEIAFPSQISANLYHNTDFIVTVSNDAWFGHSHGPDQHLEIAQVRAKEFGLPVLRATNNGITAFIDHTGEIQSRLPQFEAGVLSDQIKQVSGDTPYRTFGNIPIWCFALVIFAFGFQQKRVKRAPAQNT
ncbi:apolipoprotein N-acyltransferase [Paraglaciecola sp. 2405UD69-4]|uniref:apolipoprotein N-acyltransferase n=1 Tax=Paraglaciecola sp. 2405UD69-4 TaxID=3391836 RepID=UPI0039C97FE1